MTISAADLKIIRDALANKRDKAIAYRGISFAKPEDDPNGVAAINVWGDFLGHDGEPVRSHERIAHIEVACRFTNYGPGYHSISAFVTGWGPALVTAFDSVRAGDTVTLEWTIDNNNTDLNESGMVRDELRLHVTRPMAAGKAKHLIFEVAVEVSPRGSSARMIRPVSA